MSHLLLIGIGPVQDFIASARRSRDLWLGSWLLSDISKAVARKLVELTGDAEEGALRSLIFPAPLNKAELDPESSLSVANKILAVVDGDVNTVVTQLREVAFITLDEFADGAFERVRAPFGKSIALEQVRDVLEFYWATVEVERGADGRIADYKRQRSRLEAVLAARKSTRGFSQPSWSANLPKSSLDGLRESVIPEDKYPAPRDDTQTVEKKVAALRREYDVRRGERLCGVGLLKRHAQRGTDGDRFFSTSHLAALPLIERLEREATPTLNEYIERLVKQDVQVNDLGPVPGPPRGVFRNYDGHILFEERLRDIADSSRLAGAVDALKTFLNSVGKGIRPIPYYGLLLADGDRMGRVIDHQDTLDKHRHLSQELSKFASGAGETVHQYRGWLIYAGGDDVLAFLPLHRAIQCARKLADDFRGQMEQFKDAEDESPTLSAGLVIAHHLDPLADALHLARAAERDAKSQPGKNSFSIIVSKRSGADRTVRGHWGVFDERLLTFVEWHRQDEIPDGAAYELRNLADLLAVPEADPNRHVLEKATRAEALRIWKRKRSKRGKSELGEKVLQKLDALISSEKVTLNELADELIVAREFAAACELANIPINGGGDSNGAE